MGNTNIAGILFIVGALCWIIIIIFSKKDIKFITKEKKQNFQIILVWIMIISIIGGIYFINKPSDYEKQKEEQQEEKEKQEREQCSNKSNTYYKCGWSFIEDDCVCKQR